MREDVRKIRAASKMFKPTCVTIRRCWQVDNLDHQSREAQTCESLESDEESELRSRSLLTFPLFFGATRNVRILSTRSEWVPFFSRSRTPQTTFSLLLVK